jgi:hypothetical protein
MKMKPISISETSAIKTQTPGELPKKEHITIETRRKLENKIYEYCVPSRRFGDYPRFEDDIVLE